MKTQNVLYNSADPKGERPVTRKKKSYSCGLQNNLSYDGKKRLVGFQAELRRMLMRMFRVKMTVETVYAGVYRARQQSFMPSFLKEMKTCRAEVV